MKRILLLLLGCFIIAITSFSQTTIETDTITTTTWTLAGSPYTVDTNVVIPSGNYNVLIRQGSEVYSTRIVKE